MDNNENSINDKGNLKLLGIIVAGVLIALIVFTVGKDAWDSHNSAVAQEQAQAQAASRQVQLAQQQEAAKKQKELQDQIASLLEIQKKIGPPDSYARPADSFKAAANAKDLVKWDQWYINGCNEQQDWENDPACAIRRDDLPKAEAYLSSLIDNYNTAAAKMDAAVLVASGVPAKLDVNGNPVINTS